MTILVSPNGRPRIAGGRPPAIPAPVALALAALGALLALLPAPAPAQDLTEVLRAASMIEERLLRSDLRRYAAARREEERAFRGWDELVRRLDDALRDRSVSIAELRQLESEVTLARETATARSREVTEIRGSVFERMERLAELRDVLAGEERREVVTTPKLDGMWRLEVSPLGISGVVRMRSEGTLVTGVYRLSDNQGSVRGTLVGSRLTLERIDFRAGFDATLRGEVDLAAGRIEGTWTRVDVSGGAVSGGRWSAEKLSPREERQFGLELE